MLNVIFPFFCYHRRALLLLRKKRRLENISNDAEKQLDQMERLAHDIEFAQIQNQVIDGLKVGNLALKQLHDILNVEDIELLMDETKEAIDKQNEINEVISQNSQILGILWEYNFLKKCSQFV